MYLNFNASFKIATATFKRRKECENKKFLLKYICNKEIVKKISIQ